MTLSALGIFSAAGAGGVAAGSYDLLETQILGSSQASVVFSSLGTYSSTYKHLQIRAAVRSTTGVTQDVLYIRFNGETGSVYAQHLLIGNGSSVVSAGEGNLTLGFVSYISGASATANNFAGTVIDILDPFSATKFKTVRTLGGQTQGNLSLASMLWRSTSSTTSLTLLSNSGNLAAGSRFSLYGLKG